MDAREERVEKIMRRSLLMQDPAIVRSLRERRRREAIFVLGSTILLTGTFCVVLAVVSFL